jgi:hypothetical protein
MGSFKLGGLANGFGSIGGSGGSLGYLGQVATRAQVINSGGLNAGATATANRSTHIARDTITALQLVFANWYVTTAAGVETATGGTMTLRTSIEYPEGVFTQVTGPLLGVGSGNAAWTIASGATGVSDMTIVSIPNGATFWVRSCISNASGVLYYDQIANSAIGDRISFQATDLTMSGTIPDDVPGYCFIPQAIIGMTRRRSVMMFGDSTTYGLKDTVDSSGDMGNIARSVGPTNAYINCGIPSDAASRFKTNNTKRLALAAYCSDIFVCFGKNDSVGSVAADLATVWALFPTKRVHATTITPQTTGAWTVVNGSDQTVAVDYTTINAALVAKPAPLVTTFNIAPFASISGTPTKWFAPGYTTDGIHETQTANLAIKAGVVSAVAAALA